MYQSDLCVFCKRQHLAVTPQLITWEGTVLQGQKICIIVFTIIIPDIISGVFHTDNDHFISCQAGIGHQRVWYAQFAIKDYLMPSYGIYLGDLYNGLSITRFKLNVFW